MKMSFSHLLRWGTRAEEKDQLAADERRKEERLRISGKTVVYWTESGKIRRSSGRLVDAGEEGSGLGAILKRPASVGSPAWFVTEDGQALGSIVRHCSETEDGHHVGAQLGLRTSEVDGWGGAALRWIDSAETMRVSPASLRNAGEGRIEVNCAEELPVGILALAAGKEVTCLCVSRKCVPFNGRFLLEIETVGLAVPRISRKAA